MKTRTGSKSPTGAKSRTAPKSGTAGKSATAVKGSEPARHHRRPDAAPAEPVKPARRPAAPAVKPAEPAVQVNPERQLPKKPEASKGYKTALRSYRFQRGRTRGVVEVLDENSYVMAEYIERTGTVQWQRVVLASQREQIEKWLGEHYPGE